MRNLITLIFFLITINIIAQDEIDNRTYGKLTIGESKYLLYDKVNLRKNASAKSELVETLPIGSQLKIIAKTDSVLAINGYNHSWFQVCVLDANEKETDVKGYLWGGFLADNIFESKNDPEVKFLYGISKVAKTEWGLKPFIQIRAIINQKEVDRLDFETIGQLTTYQSAKIIGNKGIRNVTEIIHFNFSDDFCGGAFGDVYVFWDKAVLHHAKTLRSGADAPMYSDEILIFPTDKDGKEGKIIFHEESGGEDENGKDTIFHKRNTDFYWNGCELKEVN